MTFTQNVLVVLLISIFAGDKDLFTNTNFLLLLLLVLTALTCCTNTAGCQNTATPFL